MLYAMGEIVLVVVGILLAIQLNNFNERRISINKGNQFLSKLEQDLVTEIADHPAV